MLPAPGILSRLILIAIVSLLFAGIAAAQPRDHLTDQESDLIRFHQQLDKRIDVFIKAIDRRFAIINGLEQAKTKKIDKEEPEWGDLPKGSRAQLLGDIASILDEAITNIDDVSRRDEKSPLISRALRKLTAAANSYVTQVKAIASQTKDADELSAIERVLQQAEQIIEVGNQLPPPSTDKKKKNNP
jgi:HPt (histidine-containing phosphotransfer) domain-containing protein